MEKRNLLPVSIWKHNSLMNYKFVERKRRSRYVTSGKLIISKSWKSVQGNLMMLACLKQESFDCVDTARLGFTGTTTQMRSRINAPLALWRNFRTWPQFHFQSYRCRCQIVMNVCSLTSGWLIARTFNFFLCLFKTFSSPFCLFLDRSRRIQS